MQSHGAGASNAHTAPQASANATPSAPTGSSNSCAPRRLTAPSVSGALERTPLESYWGRFDCPTLLLYGADDLVGHPDNAEDLHRALPNSKLVYIEQAGHFVIVEQAERFAREICGWLEDQRL